MAAAFVLAACGGGLSKDELAKEANAICARAESELDQLGSPGNLRDADAASAFFAKVVPIADRQLRDLKALRPADDVKADWDAFVAKEQEATQVLHSVLRKARAKDPKGFADLRTIRRLGSEIGAAANKIGARNCR